jgi:thiol-disulfide isomerase/thioredoxin
MDETTLDTGELEWLADLELAERLQGTLGALEKETELLLFVSPGCAVCPHQLRSAATVALASPNVVLDVVDAAQEPELAARYEVRSVPTTVVDDELIMMGVVAPGELALRLVERQGPDAAERVFRTLLNAGHTTAAAERVADGRGTDAFLELWESSDPDQRPELLAVAEESLLYDPFGLAPLVPRLVAALDGDGPMASDEAHRADTAELLGKTGDDDARAPLERLASDPSPMVAKEAARALAELEE